MRRISRAVWLTLAGALLASLFSVVAFVRLASEPRLATRLGTPMGERLLAVATPDGVVAITPTGAYRLRADLRVEPIAWPEFGQFERLAAVRSVAWSNGRLAFIASCERAGRVRVDEQLFVIDGNQMIAVTFPHDRLFAVRGRNDWFEVYDHTDLLGGLGSTVVWKSADGNWKSQGERSWPLKAPLDAIDGMVFVDGQPLLLVGERGAHWLVELGGGLHGLPEGALSVWSPSLLRPPINNASRAPFLDEHGAAQPFQPAGPPALVVVDDALAALPVTRGLDEPGVLVTSAGARRLEVKHARRRVWVATASGVAWRAVASSIRPDEFAAFPVGERWIVLGDGGGEALVLDGALHRADTSDAAATLAALTSQPRGVWLALFVVLALFAALVPRALVRAARALRLVDGHGLHVGTLRLAPGAVLHTGRTGKVAIAAGRLRAGGVEYDLASGPTRLDEHPGSPLVDGERVYVVGAVERDDAGGPWRASHRERLRAGEVGFYIGRGGADEFARDLGARANARLLAFTLAHLTLALTVLGFLALRPFI